MEKVGPLVQCDWCPHKKRKDKESMTSDKEAENGVTWPQECLAPLEIERGRKDAPPGTSDTAWPCQHLHFSPLASRMLIEQISAVLKPPTLWYFIMAALLVSWFEVSVPCH